MYSLPDVACATFLWQIEEQKVGSLQVTVTKALAAFKLTLAGGLPLRELPDGGTRKLRFVSVTGRSAELREIRVHLDALSLNTSRVPNHPEP